MNAIPHFPDAAGLEKTDKGEEIYGGSVGINRILGMLREKAFAHDKIQWSTVFISLYSLLDNNFDKDKTQSQILEGIQQDTRLLCDYLEAYAFLGNRAPRPPVIVFYLPVYDAIASTLRRDPSPAQVLKDQMYSKIRPLFPSTLQQISVSNFSERWMLPMEKSVLPHRQLFRWIRSYHSHTRVGYYDQNRPHALISHAAMDLHLTRFLGKVTLLERYTGEVKTHKEFGTKLVQDGTVPFYSSTHRVFGDKLHIRPLISGRPRTELIARAAEEKWASLPEDVVLGKLSRATNISVTDLASIKF